MDRIEYYYTGYSISPGVEHLEAVTVGVGEQGRRDVVQVPDQRVVPSVAVTLSNAGLSELSVTFSTWNETT